MEYDAVMQLCERVAPLSSKFDAYNFTTNALVNAIEKVLIACECGRFL